ncbi:MAG: hypothetical protein GWN87_26090, partial [Desulfuromonadales bacterium]|nr:hypothetical protein [Desulfuromonadales bacterium]NIS43240.1 hypothetical protein [Desulfuromonadales bacterium]
DEYKSSLPSLLSGVEMFKDDPAILNSMIATQAALLQKSDPDKYPDLKSAVDQMQVDLQQLQEQMGGSGSFVGSMLQRG